MESLLKPKQVKQLLGCSEADRFKECKKSFQKALKTACLDDFRFHDLRHTFASQMVMRGASLKDVQEILGHKTMTMTLRYAHLSQEHKKKAINLVNGLTGNFKKELGMKQKGTDPFYSKTSHRR